METQQRVQELVRIASTDDNLSLAVIDHAHMFRLGDHILAHVWTTAEDIPEPEGGYPDVALETDQ